MSFIHPLQGIVSNNAGSVVFTVVKNMILAYKLDEGSKKYTLIGKWADQLDRDELIKEYVMKEQARQLAENEQAGKKAKKNNGSSEVTKRLEAKVPTPGPGAPPIYTQLRNLTITDDESMIIVCADSDKSVLVFQIKLDDRENCLHLKKRQPFPKRPNALTVTEDNKTVMIADKFGDVYAMLIDSEPVVKVDDEVEPVLGHVSMLTGVLMSKDQAGKHYIITSDRDEHIKVSHYPQSFIVNKWLFGHREFVSTIDIPAWKPQWLFSAGGDDAIYSWNWETGKKLDEFKFTYLVKSQISDAHLAPERFQTENNDVREIAVSKLAIIPNEPYLSFFVEATKLLIIVKVDKETGVMTLSQTIDLPFNILSLSIFSDPKSKYSGFNLTLDNHEARDKEFVKFITRDEIKGEFVISQEESSNFDHAVVDSLKDEVSIQTTEEAIYPLYNIINLKKHGEHYS